MLKKQPDKTELVYKTLDLAAKMGWENISLQDIAAHGEVSLAQLSEIFEDKTDILTAFERMIDREAMENTAAPNPDDSPRDTLFDILMDRFEILNRHRTGISAVLRSFKLDPKQAVISLPHMCRSMTWMLEAAGIETNGMRGAMKVMGLTGIYLNVLRTWLEDDSADLSKTMAALDKSLGHAERWVNTLGF